MCAHRFNDFICSLWDCRGKASERQTDGGVSIQSAGLRFSLRTQTDVYVVSPTFVWMTSFIYLVKLSDVTNVEELSAQ